MPARSGFEVLSKALGAHPLAEAMHARFRTTATVLPAAWRV
jgi:hypothetical protein